MINITIRKNNLSRFEKSIFPCNGSNALWEFQTNFFVKIPSEDVDFCYLKIV